MWMLIARLTSRLLTLIWSFYLWVSMRMKRYFFAPWQVAAYELVKLHRNSFRLNPQGILHILHFVLWSTSSYKTVLLSKENTGIDAWHEITEKFTVFSLSKPHDLFHFHVNYRVKHEMGLLITMINFVICHI